MRVARILVLALLGAALLLLLSEGALSLFLGRSWRGLFARPAPVSPALELEREQAIAARASEGPYRVPEDPLVSYTLRLESEFPFGENKVSMALRTDELGLRTRVRPAPVPEDALRIVVLGDSVAFGYGLVDEDVLAAQLERLLAAALPARPVVCETVALPSWNCRNAWRFLFDHLQRFRPALVLYLPVDNDLEDSFGVNEAGQRRASPDLVAARAALNAASARARQAGALTNPTLSYAYEQTSAGVQRNSQSIVALEQPLELTGVWSARHDAAGARRSARGSRARRDRPGTRAVRRARRSPRPRHPRAPRHSPRSLPRSYG